MEKRTKTPARALATIALVGAFVVVIAVVASLGGGGSDGHHKHAQAGGTVQKQGGSTAKTPATYVVQNGDTLTSIAHQTGVPVVRIQALNPGVDPQILISGEKLKLR
jgi:LysM repeat protein